MKKIVLDKTETISDSSVLTKCNFLLDAFSKVKDELATLDNVEYVDTITTESTSSYEKRKILFDIGYANLYLFIHLIAGNNNSFNIGLCKKNDYTDIMSYAVSGATIRFGASGGISTGVLVASVFIVTKDNKLSAIFSDFSTDNPGVNSKIYVLDTDNFGNNFIFVGGNFTSVNELYYDNDDIYAKHTVDATHVNNAIENKVWLSDTTILLNGTLKATTTGLLKICHSSLGTNSGLCGTLIDVEGVKYRKLNYCWWVEDNE